MWRLGSSKSIRSRGRTTKENSLERQSNVNDRVSALDPLSHISHLGGHRSRVRTWRFQEHPNHTYLIRLAVRNAGACRTAIGIHHHAPRVDTWSARFFGPHERSGPSRWQDCELRRKVVLGLDDPRGRRHLGPLVVPIGARTLENPHLETTFASRTYISADDENKLADLDRICPQPGGVI